MVITISIITCVCAPPEIKVHNREKSLLLWCIGVLPYLGNLFLLTRHLSFSVATFFLLSNDVEVGWQCAKCCGLQRYQDKHNITSKGD